MTEEELNQKDASLTDRENKVTEREHQVELREQTQEKAFTDFQTDVKTKLEELADREQAVKNREDAVAVVESAAGSKEMELKDREDALANRESAVASNEEKQKLSEGAVKVDTSDAHIDVDPETGEQLDTMHTPVWTKGILPGDKQVRICTVCGKTEEVAK